MNVFRVPLGGGVLLVVAQVVLGSDALRLVVVELTHIPPVAELVDPPAGQLRESHGK